MKKMRKGFTLLELLVVIGVMGILSSLAMVGGQEATNAARATNIADNLEKAASAMMMYYSDNADSINKSGTTAAAVATGASAYLKNALLEAAGENTDVYFVALSEANNASAQWYVGYKFQDADDALKAIIANKATRMQLNDKTADVPASGSDPAKPVAAYDGTTDIVYMLVR